MNNYEELIDRADQLGISIIEMDFKGRNGRIDVYKRQLLFCTSFPGKFLLPFP